MAKAKKTARGKRSTGSDAIALLKADHRQVEQWFEQFEKARDDDRKLTLATQICNALKVHTAIEEEIFYPAFLEATEFEADSESPSPGARKGRSGARSQALGNR
jgi:hemerythrin superfamily protein